MSSSSSTRRRRGGADGANDSFSEAAGDDPEGLNQFAVSKTQPLRLLLAVVGLSPSKGIANRIYKAFVGLLVFGLPVVMFWMIALDSRFTDSTMTGIAIISIAPLFSHVATVLYLGNDYLDVEGRVCLYIDSQKESALRQLSAGHAIGAIVASVFFSAYWIVNAWLSLEDQRGEDGVTPFLVVLSIVSPFSITSFLVSLTLFSLVSNFHRLQCDAIIDKLDALSFKRAINLHHLVKQSVRTTSVKFSRWLFPTIIIYSFSIVYQLWGYFWETAAESQYNGVYYLIVFFFVILFIVVVSASVTGRAQDIHDVASEIYVRGYESRAEVTHFLTYLSHADVVIRIFGVPITTAMASYLLYFVLAISGAFLSEAVIVDRG